MGSLLPQGFSELGAGCQHSGGMTMRPSLEVDGDPLGRGFCGTSQSHPERDYVLGHPVSQREGSRLCSLEGVRTPGAGPGMEEAESSGLGGGNAPCQAKWATHAPTRTGCSIRLSRRHLLACRSHWRLAAATAGPQELKGPQFRDTPPSGSCLSPSPADHFPCARKSQNKRIKLHFLPP